MPLPVSDDPVTPEGRLYVSPSLPVGDGGLPIQQPITPEVPTTDYTNANGNGVAARVINRLLGTGGEERYKTWPEKLLRDALSAYPTYSQPNPYENGTEQWHSFENSREAALPKLALDMSALAGTGGLAGVGEGGAAALGSSPFLRPALKYEGKIYKAPMGGQHMDAIPQNLQPEFTRQAMSGEDISNFNFGFMNHKGQFLDREKALKYAIDEGLMSPHDAKYGVLTSTLMADSSKPAVAIEALSNKYNEQGVRSHLYHREKSNEINLSDLRVPKENRNQGIGSNFMKELSEIADQHQSTVTLNAALDYGATSLARLKKFYKQFEFVENKGKNYDASLSGNMYRSPKESK